MTPDSTRTPTGTLQWPLPVAGTITSQFGHRVDPITGEVSSHTGTDIACAEGTPILAAADGVITVANGLDSWGGSYGYYIQIDHGGGLETLYAVSYTHLIMSFCCRQLRMITKKSCDILKDSSTLSRQFVRL